MDALITIASSVRMPAAPGVSAEAQASAQQTTVGNGTKADVSVTSPATQSQVGSVNAAKLSLFSVSSEEVPEERILKPFGMSMLPYQPLDPAIATGKEEADDAAVAAPAEERPAAEKAEEASAPKAEPVQIEPSDPFAGTDPEAKAADTIRASFSPASPSPITR